MNYLYEPEHDLLYDEDAAWERERNELGYDPVLRPDPDHRHPLQRAVEDDTAGEF
jgi:hypothetical protein